MAQSPDDSPEDDYFNDLSRQPARLTNDAGLQAAAQEDNTQVPKTKRIACVLCRKRKLKCDGVKPSCGTCSRLQHDCSYDEVRRKSGPKRGYVKALEARLAQVETLLKGQDEPATESVAPSRLDQGASAVNGTQQRNGSNVGPVGDITVNAGNTGNMRHMNAVFGQQDDASASQLPSGIFSTMSDLNMNPPDEEQFQWEMIGLGLDEPLPPQEAIDELTEAYFDKIHPSEPMMHKPRYYAAMHLAPHARPPICLRYAMWANAASVTDKYEGLQDHFYQRARKYIQQDEMRGHGEGMITIAHAQTWILLATYEFKMMYFPRAWMSAGRACRMTLMMGLHRLDGVGLDVKQCIPPPKDWTEREERRRTFWMSFCVDRYSSIGTGWPMVVEERDILTNLPTDDASFVTSRPQPTISLNAAIEASGAQKLSSFGAVVLMACLFGRNLTHLHRPGPDDNDDDLNGNFWKRHNDMDNVLLHTALAMPDTLRLPNGLNDPNVVFMNMNLHTSTICLHQAAIFKADKNRMPARVSAESKVRCITAAAEIASIMRTISHLDLSSMNPFISFCLYVAARVFVQYLKSRPKDNQVRTSLQFLLTAMHAIKRKNPLTESFLVQLDVDLESAGLENTRALRQQMPKQSAAANRSPGCPSAHIGMGDVNQVQRPPAYGDQGLAVYNQPDSQNVPSIPVLSATAGPSTYVRDPSDSSFSSFTVNNRNQFNVASREQRTPGSVNSLSDSNQYRSPPNYNPDMDTSPDGSGGGGQHTPSSVQNNNNNSSHTSNPACSPPNQQVPAQQQPSQPQPAFTNDTAFFAPSNAGFSTDFDMSSFSTNTFDPQRQQQQQQQEFLQTQAWDSGGTGLTPGASGIDIMNLSEADWNEMMEGMGEWNEQMLVGSGLEPKTAAGGSVL